MKLLVISEPLYPMQRSFVEGIIERAGMELEEVGWQVGTMSWLKEHWNHIERLMCKTSTSLLLGGMVTNKVLKGTNIKESHGGIYPQDGRLIIPCLHPGSVMSGKIQAERMLVERVVTRAVRYALEEMVYSPQVPLVLENLSPSDIDAALNNASIVVVDTEFNPAKCETHCIGFTTDFVKGKVVYSIGQVTLEMRNVLRKHFARRDLRKVAHYHFADVKALSWLGIDSVAPWFDTLTAFATLYPDLPCGLSHVARFYLDDVADWKHMDKDDPLYNAIDVINTWRIYEHECVDLADAGMWELYEEEVEPVLPLLYGMEERGLQVDMLALIAMRKDAKYEIKKLRRELVASVGDLFAKRRGPLEQVIDANTRQIKEIKFTTYTQMPCELHPKYDGLRGKKFTTQQKCSCKQINVSMAGPRTSIAALRLEITKAKGKLKRWERGFDPDNNDHVRWLLYDKSALALRVQKNRETKRATADATAVAKLLSLKTTQKKQGAVGILRAIKRIQKLEKRLSTFLFSSTAGKKALDKNACVHPQYRMRAGTGRPASGSDPYLNEKGVSENKFNVLNIPEEIRRIYVPHS